MKNIKYKLHRVTESKVTKCSDILNSMMDFGGFEV